MASTGRLRDRIRLVGFASFCILIFWLTVLTLHADHKLRRLQSVRVGYPIDQAVRFFGSPRRTKKHLQGTRVSNIHIFDDRYLLLDESVWIMESGGRITNIVDIDQPGSGDLVQSILEAE